MSISNSVKLISVFLAAATATACTIGTPKPTSAPSPTVSTSATPTAVSSNPGIEHVYDTVTDLEHQGHSVGVVVLGEEGAAQFGALREGPAWSTAKVPLATAVLQSEHSAESTPLIDAAIRESDNNAADTMWNSLGTPDQAALKVSEVIHRAGDGRTQVPSEQLQPGFSVFGQTRWDLAGQAKFLEGWRCDPAAGPVLAAMRDVVSEQRYGLGRIEHTAVKGGWGPDPDGKYLVRQFALVPWAGGDIAVAIAVQPQDGSYETGKTLLDVLAESMREFLATPPGQSNWKPFAPCGT